MKIGIIILARTNYGRWPHKITYNLSGKPLFEWVIEKSKRLHVDSIIVSTTKFLEDSIVRKTAKKHLCNISIGDPCCRHSRYMKAIAEYNLDYFIPVSPAVPFFDCEYQNRIIKMARENPGKEWYGLGDGLRCSATFPIIESNAIAFGESAVVDNVDLYYDPSEKKGMNLYKWTDKEIANRYLYNLNIAYPFQAIIAQKICDTIGHFPESYDQVKAVLMKVKI